MHNLWLIMLATNTNFIDKVRITLPKLHVKFQPDLLKIFEQMWKKWKNA